MKRTVFANWGTAKQGKSTTVKEVARLLLAAYPHAITDPVTINFSGDIKVVISIGKITIGIESQGDPNSRIFKSLNEFATINCDIIICSTRTSGLTVQAVEDLYRKHSYENVWVTNYRSSEKDKNVLNTLSAKHIFELVQLAITGRI